MAIVAELTLTGTVVPSGDPPATLAGVVDDGRTPATLTAAVSRVRVARYDSATVYYGVRVVLDGTDVSADLLGPVTITESLDNPLVSATFTLAGRRWSPALTVATWTRTPVEIHLAQGPAADVEELPELRGYVDTCSSGADTTYKIEVADATLRYIKVGVCVSYEPLAGKTRGAICRQVAAAAGITATRIPDGARYDKPVDTEGRPVFDFLGEFGATEGWYWRMTPDGTLQAYTAKLREAPYAPDYVWRLEDLDGPPVINPPQDVPSRWIVRGASAVYVDELGLRHEVTETIVEAPYAPVVAAERQETDGSRTPVGETGPAVLREVSRVREEAVLRGDLLISRTTTERGWYNPAHGVCSTTAGGGSLGGGPGPDGLYYLTSYVTAAGKFVTHIAERYLEISRRVETPDYDVDGTLAASHVEVHKWYRRTEAVRAASSPDFTVHGAIVGDDNESYRDHGSGRIEEYGLAEIHDVAYEYGPEGAVIREVEESQGWYAPRSSVNETSPYWVLYSGNGQTELTANRRLVHRKTKVLHLDASGRLKGDTEVTEGWHAAEAPAGDHDWGNTRSHSAEEEFRVTDRRDRQFNVRGWNWFEEVVEEDGQRTTQVKSGSPPMPRYRESAYTRLVQDPLELVWEDETLKEWFGHEVLVLSSEYVQSNDEAREYLLRTLRRKVSLEIEVSRPETMARPGDTVRLIDPSQGLDVRALVVQREITRDLTTGTATGRYLLEVPLL